jgi:cytochrome c-type biogenesis protein CcmF
MGTIGTIMMGVGLAAAIYALNALWQGIRHGSERWLSRGYSSIYVSAGGYLTALLLLAGAFVLHRYEFVYVAGHSSRGLSLGLRLAGLWAGQDGSLLLWAALQSLLAALVTAFPSRHSRPVLPHAAFVLTVVTIFFGAASLLLTSPFATLTPALRDGQGLNPLLRHPAMVFHPPTLYLGYVGLAAPFAFAMGGLWSGQIDRWTRAARPWTLWAWTALGLGLLLGARWAYDVLGWGGYWGWDPVENAGLMPWLTATGLLHGLILQGRQRCCRLWNVGLAVSSFALVLFGTFVTRSGVIQSVHAFGRSAFGPCFVGGISATLLASVWLIASRRRALAASSSDSGLLTQAGVFQVTLLILVALVLSILIGTLLPNMTQAVTGRRYVAGPDWFDRVTGPQWLLLVLLLGVCPLVGRAIGGGLRRALNLAAGGGGALMAVLLAALAGVDRLLPLLGFAAVGLAGAVTVAQLMRRVASSRRSGIASLGGYMVHAGVVLVAIGVIGTRAYAQEQQVTLATDQPTAVGTHELVYRYIDRRVAHDHIAHRATIEVRREGRVLGRLTPGIDYYGHDAEPISVPSIHSTFAQDLHVVLGGWQRDGSEIAVQVTTNPLARWLWIGGVVLLLGGSMAGVPRRRRVAVGAPSRSRRMAVEAEQ